MPTLSSTCPCNMHSGTFGGTHVGACGHCCVAYSTREATKRSIQTLINQQIKSVLDELEGEAEGYKTLGMVATFPSAVPLSTIQKIRSRYES